MAHPVLALGAATLTAAGNVWYIPALADLRAGDDRPRSTRLAAIACLTWWASVGAAGVLLLTPAAWQLSAAVALAGAVSGALLRSTAAADRRAEEREQARRLAAVQYDPIPNTAARRPRPAVLAWRLAAGLAASSAVVVPVLLSSHGALVSPALVMVAGGSIAAWLLSLVTAARRARP